MAKTRIRIRLKAYDYRLLDATAVEIRNTAANTGSVVVGPIPLPTRIEMFTLNSSPHVDKKSMDQFEQRTHKRFLDIKDPTAQTIDELKKLSVPAGVDISIEVVENKSAPAAASSAAPSKKAKPAAASA